MKVEYAIHNLIGTRVQAEGAAKGLRAYGWNPAEVVPVVRVEEILAALEHCYKDDYAYVELSSLIGSLKHTLTDASLKEGRR